MQRIVRPDDGGAGGAASDLLAASGRLPGGHRSASARSGLEGDAPRTCLSVEAAAAEAGVSVDTIRRAYRSGALRAFRPGGTRRIVIGLEDLQAWAFGEEHVVPADASRSQLRPAVHEPAMISQRAGQRSYRAAELGSVARLREIETGG